jgi:heptosyltransferase-2
MVERILVRAPNWIGDAVMSLGFLAALRKAKPEGQVAVLANESVADLFRGHQAADGLVEFRKAESLFSVASRTRRCGFSSGYILPLSFSSAAIVFLAEVPVRIGYDTDWRGWMLTERLRYRKSDFRSRHLLEGYCRMLGEGAVPEEPKISFLPEDFRWAGDWLKGRGIKDPVIGFGPGATYGPAKRWPAEKWVELGKKLAKNGRRILVFGSAAEQGLCRGIAASIGDAAVSCAGETGLRQSAALISKCGLFVTNDTGVMHLAAAAGIGVVGIFGSTNPAWTRPWGAGHAIIHTGEPCSPCYRRTCRYGHYRCLEGISVEAVMEAIDKTAQMH